ncbi:MAG: hypothetical protein ACYC63_05685 [Armatimonadota bacterium]
MHPQTKTWSLCDLLNTSPLELRDSGVLLTALPGIDYEDPDWREEAARRDESHLSLSRQVMKVLHRLAAAVMRGAPQAVGQPDLILRRWRRSELQVLYRILTWRQKTFLAEDALSAMRDSPGDPIVNRARIVAESGAGIRSIGRAAQQLVDTALSGNVRLRRCQALCEDERKKCGRYFLFPAQEGHPVEFCSDECRERNRRVRGRLAMRRYRDRLKL